MEIKTELGYIVLADISGFEAYLAGVELDHANGVLKELLELLVDQLAPPLSLASLEGDAVLAYAAEGQFARGETLLELTESAYAAFQDRLRSVQRDNTCNCRACLAIPTLDLKFLVHHGEYSVQPADGGGVRLGGLDANLVRERALKDQMDGHRAYALFTAQSLAQMAVRPDGMQENVGYYPHLGEIKTASLDLKARYQEMTGARRAFISESEADVVIVQAFDAPPALVWEWLNDPAKRSRWFRFTQWRALWRPNGRTGVGARNHCAHGMGTVIETILDWQPFAYFTVEMKQESIGYEMLATYRLEPLADGAGTRLHFQAYAPRTVFKWMARLVVGPALRSSFDKMDRLMAAGQAGRPIP